MAKSKTSKSVPQIFKCPHCGTAISADEARGMYIATPESKGKPFEEDIWGNFRITIEGISSQWTKWTDMAEVIAGNKRYFAVSKKSAYAQHFPGGIILAEPVVAMPIIEVATKPQEEIPEDETKEEEIPS